MTDRLSQSTNYHEYEGTSSETKPTNGVGVNSKFHELDTDDKYYFDGTAWQKIGGAST